MRILKDRVYIFIREEEMPTGVEKKDGEGFRLRLPLRFAINNSVGFKQI